MSEESKVPGDAAPEPVHRRRVRYSGKNPRRFEDKYKELDPLRRNASGRGPFDDGAKLTCALFARRIASDELIELFHFLVIAAKEGEKTRLRSRRSFHAAKSEGHQSVLDLTQIHEEILTPQTGTLANSR